MESAEIFDIQRASMVDGPGIRTVVFFKGCNLHCPWCHNPESWKIKPQLLLSQSRCTNCGECIKVCPQNAIKYDRNHKCVTLRDVCTGCGKCVAACPSGVRTKCGNKYYAEQLFNVIKADKPFYNASGGGVTFSGGECLLQIDFLVEICKLCYEDQIGIAIDTSVNSKWDDITRLFPFKPLFICDIKTMDDYKHKNIIGSSNRQILENIRNLDISGQRIWIRTPLIGGFNDTYKDIAEIRDFILPLSHVERAELLPYHSLGIGKWRDLGYDVSNEGYAVTNEEFETYKKLLDV